MNKYLGMFAISVGIAAWLIFMLLLPWFTYSRAYLFVSGMIFVAASSTIYLAWRARSPEGMMNSTRSRYLLLQGIGLFGIGMAWLFFTHYWLLAK
jgi:hypothetical protein